MDLATANMETRLVASETRAMADEAGVASPEAEKHFLRAAEAMDECASSVGAGDITGATSWLSQAVNELQLGVDTLGFRFFCY